MLKIALQPVICVLNGDIIGYWNTRDAVALLFRLVLKQQLAMASPSCLRGFLIFQVFYCAIFRTYMTGQQFISAMGSKSIAFIPGNWKSLFDHARNRNI